MFTLTLLSALAASTGSDSWPGWRGPNGNGVADGAPPIEWSEEKNVRWKTPIPGKGLSSPIVWGERVYLTTSVGTGKKAESAHEGESPESNGRPPRGDGDRPRDGERPPRGEGERPRGDGEGPREGRGPGGRGGPGGYGGMDIPIEEQDFFVLALDRKSGAVLWQTKVATAMPHQGTHPDGSYASPTIATDGEHLFASFGSYGLFALALDGKVVWQKDLGDLDIQGGFGEGSSPVLDGDRLFLNWDHEGDSFLAAFDKKTGDERWRTPRPGGTSWCTPVIVKSGAGHEIVVAGPRTIAYDPATGRELWGYGEVNRGRGGGAIASPVTIDELVLLANGGRGGGEMRALVALPADESGPDSEPLLWKQSADVPNIPSPLAYQGKVYFLKSNSGLLSVLDPTSGKIEYGPERLKTVADVYASPVAAGGHVYVAGRDGAVEVLSPWPKIETLAVNTLEDGFDSSPAIAGDELFLRGRASLYCIAAN